MDKKQALAILGLSGSASFQDARAAFRRLAKQHHPDHFARDAVAVIQAETQMKAINQAYHLLASVLPRAAGKASCVRDMPGAGRTSGFADMVMRMKKRFWKQSGRCRPAGPAGASCRTGAAGYRNSHAGIFAPKNKPAAPGASFEQVITPLFAGAGGKAASRPGTGKRFAAKPHAPYARFVRYMELKNRVRNRFQDRNHSTRVEKISRIRPVGRVDRD